MEELTGRSATRATELIDALVVGHRELARAQARCAALMMEFAQTRSVCDRNVIADRAAAGVEARYKAGEFAGLEISMALKESKYSVRNTMVVARRLRADTPDAWDAWRAGDITYDKAERISRTLGRLVRDNSKALLNAVVVDVAVCKTGELLGRWLNQFVARVEPDEQDERIGRSLADRFVSVRPDLDGVSFLSAALSSLDAASIDRVLTAIAAVAEPGDTRTLQQRRADALVDVLLGRISNGCQTRWDGRDNDCQETDVEDDGTEDDGTEDIGTEDIGTEDIGTEDIGTEEDGTYRDHAPSDAVDDDERADGEVVAEVKDTDSDQEPTPDHPETGSDTEEVHEADADPDQNPDAGILEADAGIPEADADHDSESGAGTPEADAGIREADRPDSELPDAVADIGPDGALGLEADGNQNAEDADADADPDADETNVDDWDLPASAFRPDPPRSDNPTLIGPIPDAHGGSGTSTEVHPCTCGGRAPVPAAGVRIRPVQVNIGVIISAAALLGFTNTPGQLADRSALIPADTIRDLAAQPGTLFHRLVTDTSGNLLEVNELGRFPSKKLALAITYRDGVCNADTCHTSAFRGDLDHVIPVPKGPTTAINLKVRCRKDHRAKTHAGHQTTRTGPHTTTWTTPTGHTYVSHDDPLPVEEFPTDRPRGQTEAGDKGSDRPEDGCPP